MINLLPPIEKQSIIYARRNTKLANLAIGIVVAILGMVLLFGAGQLYIASAISRYEDQVARSQKSLQEQKLNETKKSIQELSNNLHLILQVLSKEVLFSKLLRQTGAVMPPGAVLSSINISEVKGGIDLVVGAKDYQTATQVQVNLQDPKNKLFDKVDIVSVNCGDRESQSESNTNNSSDESTNELTSDYPCTINLRALFGSDTPYLFINIEGAE